MVALYTIVRMGDNSCATLDWRGDAVQLWHVLLRYCAIGAPPERTRQIHTNGPQIFFMAQNYSWHKIYHRL
jgi:hypothetical protein